MARAVARAGVAGNPSDALGGAALAVPVAAVGVEVALRPAPQLGFRARQGAPGWSSVQELVDHTERLGHEGAERLLSAAVVTLHRHLRATGDEPDGAPFELVWSTTIPRSVGLAGSSALVIAALRALCEHWGVVLSPLQLAELALRAETDELGIAAGWMDRAVQATELPTLVDLRSGSDARPQLRTVEPMHAVELLVALDPDGARPSGRVHGELRTRAGSGDPAVAALLDELVTCAHHAATALEAADVAALDEAVRRSCSARRALGALDAATAALVDAATSAGAAATSAGSGGAALVVPPAGAAERVARHLLGAGVEVIRVPLAARG